jgi:hypothetical protein
MEYKMKSPLVPEEGGYPIQLNMPTSGGTGIKLEDLESEPTIVTKKGGQGMRLVATYSPYLMKGSTSIIRAQNEPLEAENERIAISMASQWRGAIKQPATPYKPLLRNDAPDATEDEQAEALLNAELERRVCMVTLK